MNFCKGCFFQKRKCCFFRKIGMFSAKGTGFQFFEVMWLSSFFQMVLCCCFCKTQGRFFFFFQNCFIFFKKKKTKVFFNVLEEKETFFFFQKKKGGCFFPKFFIFFKIFAFLKIKSFSLFLLGGCTLIKEFFFSKRSFSQNRWFYLK